MLISDAEVRSHLHIDFDSGEDVSRYAGGAERLAAEFMNRNVYADAEALAAAVVAMPGTLSSAVTTYESSMDAVRLLDAGPVKDMARLAAQTTFDAALYEARCTSLGIVANDLIISAIKLIIGSMYANRENEVIGASVANLSINAVYLLQPFRKQMGA